MALSRSEHRKSWGDDHVRFFFALTLALIFILLGTIKTVFAYETGGVRFYKMPEACQCFPASPTSKVYISVKKTWFGERKVFTCLFSCLDPNREITQITGTQKDSYLFWDDGDHFVCRGYVMKYQETPFSKDRMGILKLGGIRPFTAAGSKIPELEAWARIAGCYPMNSEIVQTR